MLSALNLKQDLDEVLLLPDSSRWQLELCAELELLVTFDQVRAGKNLFQAHMRWTAYPQEPPSLKFRDRGTGAFTPEAWPDIPGFRPGTQDACLNICAEGFALHPEWKTDPKYRWNPRGNVLLYVLREIQSMFDFHYGGKAA